MNHFTWSFVNSDNNIWLHDGKKNNGNPIVLIICVMFKFEGHLASIYIYWWFWVIYSDKCVAMHLPTYILDIYPALHLACLPHASQKHAKEFTPKDGVMLSCHLACHPCVFTGPLAAVSCVSHGCTHCALSMPSLHDHNWTFHWPQFLQENSAYIMATTHQEMRYSQAVVPIAHGCHCEPKFMGPQVLFRVNGSYHTQMPWTLSNQTCIPEIL